MTKDRLPIPTLRRHFDRVEVTDTEPEIDIIWNTTLICEWDCGVCCVDAIKVFVEGDEVVLRSKGLKLEERFIRDRSISAYDQALRVRQDLGLELTYNEKLKVLDNVRGIDAKWDISGGDAPLITENISLIEEVSRRFGKSRVTLTATGAALQRNAIDSIGPYIGELNFTMDGEPDPEEQSRPRGYSKGNLRLATKFAQRGIATRAECPLTKHNVSSDSLESIYRDLHDSGIDKLLIMRLFPSGRGEYRSELEPTFEEYVRSIESLRILESRYGSPKLSLQCALKHLEGGFDGNACDAVTKSFGLMADGTLLGSPWAIGPTGEPSDPSWVLGNLASTTMREILASEKVIAFRDRANENSGECKYMASKFGKSPSSLDRIFERGADPLYSRFYETR